MAGRVEDGWRQRRRKRFAGADRGLAAGQAVAGGGARALPWSEAAAASLAAAAFGAVAVHPPR